jgi:hypothetical protein
MLEKMNWTVISFCDRLNVVEERYENYERDERKI